MQKIFPYEFPLNWIFIYQDLSPLLIPELDFHEHLVPSAAGHCSTTNFSAQVATCSTPKSNKEPQSARMWQSFNSSITNFRDHLFSYKYFRQGLVSNEIETKQVEVWEWVECWQYVRLPDSCVISVCTEKQLHLALGGTSTASSVLLSSKSKSQNSSCVFPFNSRDIGKDKWWNNAVTG